jgi:hypothetical protein
LGGDEELGTSMRCGKMDRFAESIGTAHGCDALTCCPVREVRPIEGSMERFGQITIKP